MKKISYLSMLVVISVLALAGCRSGLVMNIEDAIIPVSEKHSEENIKKAIVRAGGTLGWQIKDASPGHLTGTLILREHVAVIDIAYDKNKYSIKYKDSTNLNYDGESIHSNYNGWIQRLNQNIQVQLSHL